MRALDFLSSLLGSSIHLSLFGRVWDISVCVRRREREKGVEGESGRERRPLSKSAPQSSHTEHINTVSQASQEPLFLGFYFEDL